MSNINVRNIAFRLLWAVESEDAYSSIVLNNSIKENNLNKVDSAFLSALVYGVLERQITLDYILSRYSKIPLKKIELKTKIILRLGILQIVYLDKIPDSAAVNESVKLARKQKLFSSTGFINGVLRNISREKGAFELPEERTKSLSVKYSVPEVLVNHWIESYGEEITEGLMSSFSGRPRLTVRVNTLKISADKAIDELRKSGVVADKSALDENAVFLEGTGSVENLKLFRDGAIYVQDLASQLCVKALDAKPHDIVYDMCSAPGGKAVTAAMYMKNRGELFAFDVFEHKIKLIEQNCSRLGITCIKASIRNAETDKSEMLPADKVLCDVPCSGLGIIGRKPEIRYKDNLLSDELPKLQYRILCNSANYVTVGGTLVYSTCTLNPHENQANAVRFLEEHPSFEPVPLEIEARRLIDEPDNMITLFPNVNQCDGFFIAKFRRIK